MNDLQSRFPVYSRLIKLYPVDYRHRYENEILQTTADMLDDSGNDLARLAIWTKLAVDLPVNIFKQQLIYEGGIMKKEMPSYIRLNGVIAGILLLPFFTALIANGVDKIVNNQTLYSSWLWHSPVLKTWVIILPEIAALIALITLFYYLVTVASRQKQKDLVKVVSNIRLYWPVVITAVLALGILFLVRFHDSFGCWYQVTTQRVLHTHVMQMCKQYKTVVL
jgi:hypothetical protein